MTIFDPQLYRRLLADLIETVKDTKLILFVLAFPTNQLTSDSYFTRLVESRVDLLEENLLKLKCYFELNPRNEIKWARDKNDLYDGLN
jgi:hypothetical protein